MKDVLYLSVVHSSPRSLDNKRDLLCHDVFFVLIMCKVVIHVNTDAYNRRCSKDRMHASD